MSDHKRESSSRIHPLLAAVFGPVVHTDAGAIREAIQISDMQSAAEILARCADVNSTLNDPNSELWTPLEIAAGSGSLEAIHLLIDHGASVHAHSRHCGGPLFRAFEDSQAGAVRLLLELGADPNGGDVYGGEPALISAVWWAGETRRNGGDGAADRSIVSSLLEHGANINDLHDGKTALMTAVHNAGPDPELVRILLDHGADIHARDTDGCTALDEARSLVDWDVSRGRSPRPESVEILRMLEEALNQRQDTRGAALELREQPDQ